MKTKVKDFIYTGGVHSHIMGTVAKLDPSRCAFSVAEYGRITNWHQCFYKITETIDGFGFCKVHAKEVKRSLGLLEATRSIYAARFEHGEPNLVILGVVNETEATIEVSSIKEIMGSDYGISTGLNHKNSQYLRPWKFFAEKVEATAFLRERAYKHLAGCEIALDRAKEEYLKLC